MELVPNRYTVKQPYTETIFYITCALGWWFIQLSYFDKDVEFHKATFVKHFNGFTTAEEALQELEVYLLAEESK